MEEDNVQRPTSNVQRRMTEGAQFQIGEKVWSAINPEDHGMVTVIVQNSNGYSYMVHWADSINESSEHQAIELSREPLYQVPTR